MFKTMKPGPASTKIQLAYNVVRFPHAGNQFIAMAFNYRVPAFISTPARSSFEAAERELESMAEAEGMSLRFFQGAFFCDSDDLLYADDATEARRA